jgi:UDP-glucose 4-epimerase
VKDLANAHVLALRALEQGSATTCYNLGNGKGYSVKEVISIAKQVSGKPIPIEFVPRRDGDPARLVADPGLAMRKLGWLPEYAQLQVILETAWRWHNKYQSKGVFL